MIKAIFFLSIISYWNVIGGPPPIISKITFTEEELVIDGTQLEDTKSVSIRTLENKILKDFEVDNGNPEKIVARALGGSFEPGDKNLYLVITDSEGELFYPITLRSKTGDRAVYKITQNKNPKIPNKIVVDEKSEINFSPGDNSGRYYYNYSIYANPVGDLAIKNEDKELLKIDQEGNLEILGSLKVKGKTLKFNNGVINTLNFENYLFPVLPPNQREGDFRVKDVVIGVDNNISGVVDFSSTGDMDVATATFHVESSTGRVGIGNATPTYKLDVQGATNSGIRLRQAAVSTNTSGAFFNGMVFEDPGQVKSFGIGYGVGDLFSINSYDGTYRNIFSLNNLGNGVISGSLKIGAYTLPSTDGTSGQVLSTNGAGIASWTSAGAGIGDVVGPATSTLDNLASFSSGTGKAIKDSGIDSANLPIMVAAAASSNTVILSGGADKTLTTTNYTIPSTIGSPTYVLKSDGTNAVWEQDNPGTQSLIAPTRVNATGLLPMFFTADGNIITDSDIEAINVPEMTASPTAANQIIISTGNGKNLTTTIYPISPTIGATGTVLKSDGSGAFWQPEVSVANFIAGPATATINSIARFESGKVIKESGITIDDLNNISGVAQLNTKVANNLVIGTGIGVDRNLPIYVGLSPTEIEDSGISLDNIPIMATGSTGTHQIIISAGPGKQFTTTLYPIPVAIGASDTVLKSDGTGATWQPEVSVANFTAGPATSTQFALARYDGTSGKILKNSLVELDDLGNFNFLRAASTTVSSHPCPSMSSAEKDALLSPLEGDCVFDTNLGQTNYWGMGRWGNNLIVTPLIAGGQYKKAEILSYQTLGLSAAKDFTASASPTDDYFNGNINFNSVLPVTTCTSQGGEVIIMGAGSSFDILAGKGLIVTNSPGTPWPDETRVQWTNSSIAPASTSNWNTIYIDENGTSQVMVGKPTPVILRTKIVLAVVHPNLQQVEDHRGTCFDQGTTIRDLNYVLGPLKKGFEYYGNADLKIGRNAGEIYSPGINFGTQNHSIKNYLAQPSAAISYYMTRNSQVGGTQTFVDPNQWDNGAGLVPTTNANRWTYQRIYLVAGGVTAVQYGQREYATLASAVSGVTTDAPLYAVNSNLAGNAKWIATMVLKSGTTALNAPENAFINCGIFGCSEGGGGSSGGGGGGDVFGPTASVADNLATFGDISGKLIGDSGIKKADLTTMATGAVGANQIIISAGAKALSSTIYQIPPAIGATGTVLKSDGANATWETDFGGTGDVVGPASASSTNLASFGATGKIIQDSGIIAANVVTNSAVTANNAIPRFSGTMGTIIQNSGVTIDGSNNISGILNIAVGASATINGALIINNNGANSSAFPTTRGSGGQALITNGSGALSWGSVLNAPTSTDKTGAYTIAATDCQNTLTFTHNTTPATFTVPNTLPVGCQINIVQMGTAQVSFVGTGITVTNGLNLLKTRTQFSPVTLLIVNASYGILGGDVGN